jgi:hypothetical protein
VIANPNGCEWEPARDRPAFDSDEHHRTTRATVLVGHDGAWRLCDRCSMLSRFRRYRVRRPIAPAVEVEAPLVLDDASGLMLPDHVAATVDYLRARRATHLSGPEAVDSTVEFLLSEFGQTPDEAAPMGPAAVGVPGPDQETPR